MPPLYQFLLLYLVFSRFMKFPPYKYSFIIIKTNRRHKSIFIRNQSDLVVVIDHYSLILQNIYITIYTLLIILTIILL